MDTRQVIQAYADWCASIQPDFYFVLNYQPRAERSPLSFDQLSDQVRKLFYRLEVGHWTYAKRESRRGRYRCRIQRAVCIEKASTYHANVMMTRYSDEDDETLLTRVRDTWLDIQRMSSDEDTAYLFQLKNNNINNLEAVSLYSNKDTVKANKRNEDTFCTRASFIRKHSNRR